MGKWRPSENCIYVIPDIHGMADELELILNRILPLRKIGGVMDTIIFLGDYIDRRFASHMVVDMVINAKSSQPDQIFCLLGNHELLIQDALSGSLEGYRNWMRNGGEETLLGYLKRAKSEIDNPYLINRSNIERFIPKEHMKFFKSLIPYYETEEYIFVHGGCDPFIPLKKQRPRDLVWDRSVFSQVDRLLFQKGIKCSWNKTLVTGHNGKKDGKPLIWDKFMMLDGSYANKLYVWELNSRTGFSARRNNKRMVKESIT